MTHDNHELLPADRNSAGLTAAQAQMGGDILLEAAAGTLSPELQAAAEQFMTAVELDTNQRQSMATAPPATPARESSIVLKLIRNPVTVTVIVVGVAASLWFVAVTSENPVPAVTFIVIGGVLGIVKELMAAFAENVTDADESAAASKRKFQGAAVVFSTYAAVFGFPGIVAGAAQLLLG
ncbi:hypothetical protein SAMN06295974_1354 [Plantibacter flavus]|uniref:Uncharacterized protein n=1 Tax=Plantibacter flavus TaxID=150123 RepID=A0A3N2C739_9MICO|nr:hypothetical protein [Plantibacter flavus]ROR83287.1 hypothetical protein EDD42_3398 [Plantibacter flavus]SMG22315.1 hypothetical protein SAMN06295974_1354 [Plantibacter flavus]